MSKLLRHFGFRHHPFARKTPKDAILRHQGFDEALNRLRYSVDLDSIAVLVAESGCGKSLLLGVLAGEMQREGITTTVGRASCLGRSPSRSRPGPGRGRATPGLGQTASTDRGRSLCDASGDRRPRPH